VAKGDKEERKVTPKDYLYDAGYAMTLLEQDETGSFKIFVDRVKDYMKKNKGRIPTARELNSFKEGVAFFETLNADQEKARMDRAMADPEDWERGLEVTRQQVQNAASVYGITLSDEELKKIAEDVRLDGLTDLEIQDRFGPILQQQIGGDLGGQAAEFQREISQWTSSNGLRMNDDSLFDYVKSGVEGKSSLEDIKNDLRRDYLAGMYPAYAQRIMQGYDPSVIFQPFLQTASQMLEVPDIGFNDPLMQSALQATDDAGNPVQTSLYDFEKQIRNDPRWQYTDDAYETYASAGTRIASMFGFG